MLGNIGPAELFFILFVVLLLFGAKRLPEVAKSIGRSITEFKKAMNSNVSEIEDKIKETETKIIKA